jgi:hypothetical protein
MKLSNIPNGKQETVGILRPGGPALTRSRVLGRPTKRATKRPTTFYAHG